MWNGSSGHWNAMGWGDGIGSWFMGFHGILWILLLVLIVFALIHLVRGPRREPERDPAVSALAEEYARGRIDRDEYLRRREDLTT